MVRVFVAKDLPARDSDIVLLSRNESAILPVSFRQRREVVDRRENIQARSIRFPQEFNLTGLDAVRTLMGE